MTCSCVLLKGRLVVFSQLCVLYQACVRIQSNSEYRSVRSRKKKARTLQPGVSLHYPAPSLLHSFSYYMLSRYPLLYLFVHIIIIIFYRYNHFLSTVSSFKLVPLVSTSLSHIYFKDLKDMDNTDCIQNTFKQY